MTRRHAPLLVLIPLLLGLGPLRALAAPAPAAAGVTMDQAVKMAVKRFHGRVIKAETQKDGGKSIYVLKLLDDKTGHVRTVHVDAATGSVQ
jgi:outer membrane lipoprotein SlyB